MSRPTLLNILVSPSANSRLYYAPSGKALTLGLKNMVKFAEGELEINPALKMYFSLTQSTLVDLKPFSKEYVIIPPVHINGRLFVCTQPYLFIKA
jgi:hypothetical protein